MAAPFVIAMRIDGTATGAVQATGTARQAIIGLGRDIDLVEVKAKDLDAALSTQKQIRVEASGFKETLEAIRAEQQLEAARLSAQISETGRSQSLSRLAALGRDAAAATQALAGREADLAKSEQTIARVSAQAGEATDQLARSRSALRAEFNPLFAAQQRYEQQLLAIDHAHKLGALSSAEMAAAINREKAALTNQVQALQGYTQRAGAAGIQTANLAAQFQDIAVSAQMGMSPLQVALQQGTQISAAFGEAGAAGAAKALGAAFMSVISPVSILTIGAVALGTAGIQAFMNIGHEAENVATALEKHKAWLNDILQGYDDVRQEAEQAAEAAQKLPEASASSELTAGRQQALAELEASLQAISDFQRRIQEETIDISIQSGAADEATEELQSLLDMVTKAGLSVDSTKRQFDDLDVALTAIKNSDVDENIRYVAGALLDLLREAKDAQGGVDSVSVSLRAIPTDIRVRIAISTSTEFGSALEDIEALYTDPRSQFDQQRESLKNAADQATATAASYGELVGISEKYQRSLDSINAAEAKADAKHPSAGAKALDTWGSSTESYNAQTDAINLQSQALSMSTYAAAQARAEMDLLNEAQKAGVDITPELRTQIEAMAGAYADAQVKLEQTTKSLKAQQEELNFYKQTFTGFITSFGSGWREAFAQSEADKDAYRLKTASDLLSQAQKNGAHVTALQRAEIIELSHAMADAEYGATALDRAWKSAWKSMAEAASNALGKIADRAMGLAADGIWDMIMGAFSGALGGSLAGGAAMPSGGFVPGLTGPKLFESGGWTGGRAGQAAGIVHGEEFVVRAGPAARNRAALEAMNRGDVVGFGGAPTVVYAPNLAGLNGVSRSEVQSILAADKARFVAAYPLIHRDAVRRAKING